MTKAVTDNRAGVGGADMKADIEKLAEDFENCRKVLIALGE